MSYVDNSGIKFRDDISSYDYIMYRGDGSKGYLVLKKKGGGREWFVCEIPMKYWKALLGFVHGWDESSIFRTKIDE